MPVRLSIVIPAYNEATRLPASLGKVREFCSGRYTHEVLVVDDGSRDGTADIVEQAAATWPELRLLRNPGNRGKGYSVRHGMLHATGDWLLFTDADLSTPIEDVVPLLAQGEAGCDVVIGSRALRRDLVGVHQSALREIAGRVYNVVMRIVLRLPFRDTQCGFKLFARPAAQEIFSRQLIAGFGFDAELLFLARKLGYRAAELPVHWNNSEGSKVSMFGGLAAFTDLALIRWWNLTRRYRLSPSERS